MFVQMFVTHVSNVNLGAVLKACETRCSERQTKSSFNVIEPAQMSKISTLKAMMNKGLSVQLFYWRFHLFNLVWSWILLAAMSSLFFCGRQKWIGSLFSICWNKCDDPERKLLISAFHGPLAEYVALSFLVCLFVVVPLWWHSTKSPFCLTYTGIKALY